MAQCTVHAVKIQYFLDLIFLDTAFSVLVPWINRKKRPARFDASEMLANYAVLHGLYSRFENDHACDFNFALP